MDSSFDLFEKLNLIFTGKTSSETAANRIHKRIVTAWHVTRVMTCHYHLTTWHYTWHYSMTRDSIIQHFHSLHRLKLVKTTCFKSRLGYPVEKWTNFWGTCINVEHTHVRETNSQNLKTFNGVAKCVQQVWFDNVEWWWMEMLNQHHSRWWPNAFNMLNSTMLNSVEWKC